MTFSPASTETVFSKSGARFLSAIMVRSEICPISKSFSLKFATVSAVAVRK